MITLPPSVAQFKTEFERARRWRRARREPLQFGDLRWEALDRFLSLGFPTPHQEQWRSTDIASITEKIFTLSAPSQNNANRFRLAPCRLPDDCAAELVFVNGYFLPEASTFTRLPPGARVGSLSDSLDGSEAWVPTDLARVAPFANHAFVALNTALFADGACIRVSADTVIDKPIHVRFISTGEADLRPAMSNPRVLVILAQASKATMIESYLGAEGAEYLTNAVTEIVLGENATLDRYKLQCESIEAYHIGATYVVAASGASCSAHSIVLGGALGRDEFVATLGGEDVNCTLGGLYVADGKRLVDQRTMIGHLMPRCRSRQSYSAILADQARGVFDGGVTVHADAHTTHVEQTIRSLRLSGDARIESTSHLANLARGLDCTQREVGHRIDEEAAFYTRTRGVGDAEARRLAVLGFVRDMLRQLPLQPLARCAEELVEEQITGALDNPAQSKRGVF